jgi:hypothetical protein
MTHSDYNLLIHICHYALRKGSDLDVNQVSDIDRIIKKLHKEQQSKDRINANLRNKKVGKRKRLRSN